MLTVSSCGVKLQEVPLGLEKKAKTLDIHMHFLWLFSTFIHFFNFSTWGVIFQKLKENGVQTVKYIVDGEVWRQAYKMQTHVYPRNQNIEAGMMKRLSAGCVNTVVACGILITSDYIR